MNQETIEKTIEKNKLRSSFDKATEELKKSGALPEDYPNHKGKKPYELLRSELNDYKKLHGREFELPKNSVIIEDI